MTFSIRDATPADIPALTAIYRESVENGVATYEIEAPDETEMAARFATITGHGYPYIVATDADGKVLGYAYASAFRTRAAYRFLVEDSIYLGPEARGRGIGRALLDQLVCAARRSASARWSPSSAVRIPPRSACTAPPASPTAAPSPVPATSTVAGSTPPSCS